jgi:outer membrane murein-binding lipoprotein Lpp
MKGEDEMHRTKLTVGMMIALCLFGVTGCVRTDQLQSVERRVSQLSSEVNGLDRKVNQLSAEQNQLESALKRTESSLAEDIRSLNTSKASAADLASARDSLAEDIRSLNTSKASAADLASARDSLARQVAALEGKKADRTDIERLDREKFDVQDIEKLGLDEMRRRLISVEYQLRSQREELLSAVSTGYRNAVQAARETAIEMQPVVSKTIRDKREEVAVFIRDFRTLDDQVTVLGDLLSREFAAFMKHRTGVDKIYREKDVIRLYQQKQLQVPAKDALNLDNLEKGGFPTRSVIVVSGRITPTSRALRLDVEAIDLQDPEFQASAHRLIPRDNEVDEMNSQVPGAPPEKE